jgi:hypothetical protein
MQAQQTCLVYGECVGEKKKMMMVVMMMSLTLMVRS